MSKITSAIAALGVVAGLGVAALPLSTYAQTSGPVTVKAEVNSSISVEYEGEPEVNFGTLLNDSDVVTRKGQVTVKTTNENGYTLTVRDTDADNALTKTGADGLVAAAKIDAGTPAKNTTAWGIAGGDLTGWNAVPASTANGLEVKKVSTKLTDGTDTVDLTFGISIGTLEDGVYSTDIVFTAVANEAVSEP